MVESMRCQLRAKRRGKLRDLTDAVIFAKRDKLRFCKRLAQYFSARACQLAVLHADRAAIFLQSLRELGVLRRGAGGKNNAGAER